MGCMSGQSQEYIPPSASEIRSRNRANEAADRSYALSEALLPSQLAEMGYTMSTPTVSPDVKATMDSLQNFIDVWENAPGSTEKMMMEGQYQKNLAQLNALKQQYSPTYRKMTNDEFYASLTPIEKLEYDNATLQAQRVQKALKGELDISPALEKSLQAEERAMAENLATNLGPNWQQSTAGQTAMRNLQEKNNLIREEARRGEISSGTGLMLNQIGSMNNAGTQSINNLAGLGQSYLPYVGAYNQTLSPYMADRNLQMNVGLNNVNAHNAQVAGLYQGIGQLVGTAGSMAMGYYGNRKAPQQNPPSGNSRF